MDEEDVLALLKAHLLGASKVLTINDDQAIGPAGGQPGVELGMGAVGVDQVDAVVACGADFLELHTGAYANAVGEEARLAELHKLIEAARYARQLGMRVNAGHGLNLRNVMPVAAIEGVHELHIGHSIVSHAVLVGFERAVREMVEAIARAQVFARDFSPEEILRLHSA